MATLKSNVKRLVARSSHFRCSQQMPATKLSVFLPSEINR